MDLTGDQGGRPRLSQSPFAFTLATEEWSTGEPPMNGFGIPLVNFRRRRRDRLGFLYRHYPRPHSGLLREDFVERKDSPLGFGKLKLENMVLRRYTSRRPAAGPYSHRRRHGGSGIFETKQ